MINKRGTALDLIYFVIGAFVLAVSLLIIWQMWADVNPVLSDTIGGTPEVDASIEAGTQVTGMFDMVFMGGVISMFLVMIILAMLISVNPVFYIVYFVYLMVAILLSPVISNAYESMTNSTTGALYSATQAMPIQTFFMTNLPIITLMFGIVVIIVTYAKFGMEGGGER